MMITYPLEDIIKLIEQGERLTAQAMLKQILASEPHDLTAWSWYVKTFTTDEDRIKALELCLQHNPEKDQVKQALRKIQSRQRNKQLSLHSDEQPKTNPIGIILKTVTIIAYFILIGSFIAHALVDIYYYENFLRSSMLGWVVAIYMGFFIAIHWAIMCTIISLHMLLAKRKMAITIGILGTGLFFAIISFIFIYLVLVDGDVMFAGNLLLIFTAFVASVFVFVSWSGIVSMLIFLFDVLMKTDKWTNNTAV